MLPWAFHALQPIRLPPPGYCLRDSGPYQPGKLQFLITCWLFKRLATGVVLLIQFRSNVSQAVLSLVWFLGDGRSPLRCGNGVCGSPSSRFCRYVGLFYSGAAKLGLPYRLFRILEWRLLIVFEEFDDRQEKLIGIDHRPIHLQQIRPRRKKRIRTLSFGWLWSFDPSSQRFVCTSKASTYAV